MTANRRNLRSDLKKSDRHTITSREYDEIPEITDDEVARAVEHQAGVPVRRGRPKLDRPKEAVKLRIDADVMDALRGSGAGWQTRANDILRRAVLKPKRRRTG